MCIFIFLVKGISEYFKPKKSDTKKGIFENFVCSLRAITFKNVEGDDIFTPLY